MDKFILAILAGAVVLHFAGAFETNSGGLGNGDDPPMSDAPASNDTAGEQGQGKGAEGQPQPQPKVVVYGRDASQPTERMLAKLEGAEIDHQYKSVEEQKAMLEVGMRLKKKGYEKDSYQLPVVGIDERTLVQPSPAKVIAQVKPDS